MTLSGVAHSSWVIYHKIPWNYNYPCAHSQLVGTYCASAALSQLFLYLQLSHSKWQITVRDNLASGINCHGLGPTAAPTVTMQQMRYREFIAIAGINLLSPSIHGLDCALTADGIFRELSCKALASFFWVGANSFLHVTWPNLSGFSWQKAHLLLKGNLLPDS